MSRRGRKADRGVDDLPNRLKALGYSSYREYLLSTHWAQIWATFYRSLPPGVKRCAACGLSGVKLSVHHRTYRRLGRERNRDLVLVCGECHWQIHFGIGYSKNLKLATMLVVANRGKAPPPTPVYSRSIGPETNERLPCE